MFENLPMVVKEDIFVGLKALIESKKYNSSCFHNGDLGHPVYTLGANGVPWPSEGNPSDAPDSPENNHLFKMLSELSIEFKESEYTGNIWWYDFSDWQKFCTFVVDVYHKQLDR